MDYTTWKEHGAAKLVERHEVSATSVCEREWKRLFISKFSPVDAAERAYAFWLNTQPAKFRSGLRRDISEALRAKQTPRERLSATFAQARRNPVSVVASRAPNSSLKRGEM